MAYLRRFKATLRADFGVRNFRKHYRFMLFQQMALRRSRDRSAALRHDV